MNTTRRRLHGAPALLAAVLTLLAVALWGPVEARAQWTQPDANNNINNTNTGNVGVGTASPSFNLHVVSSADPAAVAVDGYGAAGVNFIGRRANGSFISPSAVLANNNLFTLQGRGYGATGFSTSSRANIKMFSSENWTDAAQGTYITFATTPNGTVSTSERLRIENNGNVGVGTAAPAARLHVLGENGASTGGAAPPAFTVVGGAGGNGQTAGGAGGDLSLQGGSGGWNTTGSSFYYSGNGGGVSLTGGTGGQHLFGVSHAGTGGPINLTGGTGGAHNVSGYAGGAGGSITLNGGVGGTGTTPGAAGNIILANLRGNVGVGTTAPGALLEVKRDQATGTEVRVNNANASGFAGVYLNGGFSQSAGGFLQWNNVTGNNNLFVATGGGAPLHLGTNNTVRMTVLPTSGNVGVGTATPGHRLDVAGNVNAGGLCIAGVCKTDWSQVGGGSQWTTAGANIHFSTGNVGLGTAAPATKLAVGGAGANVYNTDIWAENNAHVQGNETLTQGGRGRMRVGTAWGYVGLYAETSSTGAANDLVLGSGSGNVRVGPNASAGAPAMNLLVPNGNFGVGTASPSKRLHVHGGNVFHQYSSTAGQEYGFYTSIHNNHFTSNLYFDGQWRMLSAGKGAIISTAPLGGPAFVVYADNTSRAAGTPSALTTLMQVTMDGNVGVGAAAPAYKLDVQGGQVNASGGLCIAGVCKSDWSQVGGSSQWASGESGVISYTSGNVGVGTSTPAAKLHVTGGARLDGAGRVYLGTGATQGARGLELVEENATTFSLRHHDPLVAWRNIALNPHGGDVGVGTVSPRGKLEVAGGALFLGDMGNASWGNVVVRGRVFSASSNIHLSPPGGMGVYIDSNYREAGGSTGPVNLHVSGDVIAGGNITAKYQDVAEWVPSTQKLRAGTVVVLDAGRTNHVIASGRAYDTAVAGVVSDSPGVLLGVGGEGKVKVATTGRVRVKVDATRAPIRVGDLLVTSDVEGVAMKSLPVDLGGTPIHRPGTIIGKALEPLEKGAGEILVLLSLQ